MNILKIKSIKLLYILSVLVFFSLPQFALASEKDLSSKEVTKWIQKWTSEEKMPFLMGVLATVDKNNHAQSRAVAIREITSESLLIFTQKGSSKVGQIKNNPYVSMTILLPDHKRQITFDGIAKPISKKENIEYWNTYPLSAQIRFLAYGPTSGQPIKSNKHLDELVSKYKKEYKDKSPEYPESYIGYRVYPTDIKFYQMNSDRMSDSYILKNKENEWNLIRVVP
ncbi:pyridoxamine 5'-phosphate oxidase [Allofrancisella inopinata]|uniref:pyridoxamine 5'-phosphate oxidase family protein n=2 Tax=Francisellaceae TaxID=34064 RepID=UPI00106412CE|nr:pyridoxamine 5'-phosphate oxidase family protein [Allofrancisella inopinata]TDT66952.1 pyridoxamine 5'-phosphate oxidase [Allofrancisella inopinata]